MSYFRYQVPSRPTVIKRLEEKKLKVEDKLKSQLKLSADISITHDGWTSLNTESYYTTTVHFIDKDWCLQSAVLGTIKLAGSRTGQNIANELKNTQDLGPFLNQLQPQTTQQMNKRLMKFLVGIDLDVMDIESI